MAEKCDEKPQSSETYELDLDWNQSESLEDVFEQAVAAVDRDEEVAVQPEVDETAAASEETTAEEEVAADSPPVVVDEATLRTERLESELGALRDRLMRTLADFENYRKRTEREKEATRRFASADRRCLGEARHRDTPARAHDHPRGAGGRRVGGDQPLIRRSRLARLPSAHNVAL